jgi:ketosteroid isomerase-like protein
MSQANVEVVRQYYEAVREGLADYWARPRSAAEAMASSDLSPQAREVLRYLHPDVQWTNAFGATFRGHLGCAEGFDQLLEAAQSYQIAVHEVTDLGGDHVLTVVGAAMTGTSSGIDVSESVFSTITLREGLILRIDEYLNRPEALEAVGLSEWSLAGKAVHAV